VVDRIRALHRPDRPPVLGRLIDMYLESAPDLINQIAAAVCANDDAELRQAAHLLKSQSASLGANIVADLARALESHSRGTRRSDPIGLTSELEREYERAVQELLLERPFQEA
jgi:HPt (histidine-containing phosphotransfer) domain-containing protein